MPNSHVLLRTKLYRPKLPTNHLKRNALIEKLEAGVELPLTLVAASAGYGKSTLVSSWLTKNKTRSAWLSVHKSDNKLNLFFRALLGAIKMVFDGFGKETELLLHAAEMPPLEVLYHTFINELTQIEKPLIITLDDYHCIENEDIHGFIIELLQHPIEGIHLVLICRFDPPLPLYKYRVDGTINEVRTEHICFSQAESTLFLNQNIELDSNSVAVQKIVAKTEGWVTGLRLLVLSLKNTTQPEKKILKMEEEELYSLEYLSEEVLQQLTSELREFIIKTSILDEFNPALCDHLLGTESSQQHLKQLEELEFFIIPLDHRHNWYRYHHLFQDQMLAMLHKNLNASTIETLHGRAGDWLGSNGNMSVGFDHLVQANQMDVAIELFKKHRKDFMNKMMWELFYSTIEKIPNQMIKQDPELILCLAWTDVYLGKRKDVFKQIVNKGFQQKILNTENQLLIGELHVFLSYHRYIGFGETIDFNACIAHAEAALKLLDRNQAFLRGFAWIFYGGALIAQQKNQYLLDLGYEELSKNAPRSERLSLHMIINYANWFDANLAKLALSSKVYCQTAKELSAESEFGTASTFLAYYHYQTNNIKEVIETIVPVYPHRFLTLATHHVSIVGALVLGHAELGQFDEAESFLDALKQFTISKNNAALLVLTYALEAEVAFKKGDRSMAFQLLNRVKAEDYVTTISDFYYHNTSFVKMLLYAGGSENLLRAAALLDRSEKYFEQFNYQLFLAENWALKALLAKENKDVMLAQCYIENALQITKPSGMIQVFIDLGDKMNTLLQTYRLTVDQDYFVDRVLNVFSANELDRIKITTPFDSNSNQVLTRRENEILGLLAEKLTNKEIGVHLNISEETVKRHTKNLYQKLQVKGRQSAVTRGVQLGIIV